MHFKKIHSGSETNIFTEIAHFSEFHSAVNLSQSSPDYPLDPQLKTFLKEAVDVDMNPYASKFALPLLKESIIKFNARRKNPLFLKDSETSIVPGATYGMSVALASFIEPDDEIIVIEPCYDTYRPVIEIRRAKPVYVSLNESFEMDWDQLKDSITVKTKAIFINSPHNPTGKVWEKEDWDTLWEIIKHQEIVVISDEVYDLILYDNREHYSAFHHPNIKNRCFCIYSFEKMFHLSGWKASYIVASEDFTKALRNVHQYLCFTINYHAQYAIAKYLQVFDIEKNQEFFQKKRDLLLTLMRDLPFEYVEKVGGGYSQTFSFRDFKPNLSDKDFVLSLIENAKVATIPYSVFYHDQRNTQNFRICFAKKDETIVKAVENLRNWCSVFVS